MKGNMKRKYKRKPFLILKKKQHSRLRTGLFPRYMCLSAAGMQQRHFWRKHLKKKINRKTSPAKPLNLWTVKALSLGEVKSWTESSELESSSKDKKEVKHSRLWEAHHRTFYLHQQFPLEQFCGFISRQWQCTCKLRGNWKITDFYRKVRIYTQRATILSYKPYLCACGGLLSSSPC